MPILLPTPSVFNDTSIKDGEFLSDLLDYINFSSEYFTDASETCK